MNKRSSLLKDVLRLLRHLVRAYRPPFTPLALNGKNDAIKFRTCKRGFKINPKYGRTSVVGDTTSTQKNHCQLAACGADSLPEQTILCPGARFWQVLPCLLEMYFPWALAAPGRLSPKLHPGRDEHRERRRRAEREGEPMVRRRSGISSHRVSTRSRTRMEPDCKKSPEVQRHEGFRRRMRKVHKRDSEWQGSLCQ